MEPLVFEPILKQTIWGGRRLGDLLGKPIGDGNDYAESWEIVDRADCQSRLAQDAGQDHTAGSTLQQLIQRFPKQLLGSAQASRHQRFPLLVKFLDCHQVLSVQVHPADDYALAMPQPDLGKTEAWYVVEAAPGARLYAGLKDGVGPQELRDAIAAGQTEQTLHVIQPQVGQCLFIPAGTVHALGGGLVVAEIQQSSDTTFRLFDWDRVGADGRGRPLHLDQALAVTDYAAGPVVPQVPQPLGDGRELLVDCPYFQLQQIRWGGGAAVGQTVTLPADDRLRVAMVVAGAVTLATSSGYHRVLPAGQTVLIPAAAHGVTVWGTESSVLLLANLP